MKGLLKAKSPTSQLVTFLGIIMVSFFVFVALGQLVASWVTGVGYDKILEMVQSKTITPEMVPVIRVFQAVQFVSFVLPCIICGYLFSLQPARHLGFRKPHNVVFILMAMLAMVLINPFTTWLGEMNKNIPFPDSWQSWITEKEQDAQQSVKAMLGDRSINNLLINLVVIAGMAAVGEELVFRSILQRIFTRMFRSPWAGIIIAAFLFSAMHMQFLGFLPRFVLGILLGAIYWYSGSIWTAIIAHFFYDAALIVIVYVRPDMLEQDSVDVDAQALALVAAISFLLTAAVLRWMMVKSRTRYEEVYAEELNAKDHPF